MVKRYSQFLLAPCVVLVAIADSATWPRGCQSTDTADELLKGLDMSHKTVILSGADGHIAGEVGLALAKAKATMVLACRSTDKCAAVQKKITSTVKDHESIEVEQLDLSSKANIAAFVNRTIAKHPRVDVLINAAGTYGTFMTHDNLVGAMEINLMGPALLVDLLLPALRGTADRPRGRVVHVAAATYGHELAAETTAQSLAALCTKLDPTLNATGGYFSLSKFLMTHHAAELGKREPQIAAFAVNPGVAILPPGVLPTWLKHAITHAYYPKWLQPYLPKGLKRYIDACSTNEAGLRGCPQSFDQGAGVIVSAAAWKDIEPFSGSYLDFDTTPLPPGSKNVYGLWTQKEPTCTPRTPTPMDEKLRSDWYDEMLRLMHTPSTSQQTTQAVDDEATPVPDHLKDVVA